MIAALKNLEKIDPSRGIWLRKGSGFELLSYPALAQEIARYRVSFRDQGVGPGDSVLFPFDTQQASVVAFLALVSMGAVPYSVKPAYAGGPRRNYLEFLARVRDSYAPIFAWDLDEKDLPGPRPLKAPPRKDSSDGVQDADGWVADDPARIAFVQFSSGSTSFPKGIPISHGNLSLNLKLITDFDGRSFEDRCFTWLPLFHDMGLIGTLLTNIYRNNSVWLSDPTDFLSDPLAWLEALAKLGITVTAIPNFGISFALKALESEGPSALKGLDFSRLGTVYLGSEPIHIDNLRKFEALLAPAGWRPGVIVPCYGMAEAVLIVTGVKPGTPFRVCDYAPGMRAISVGRPLEGFELRIAHEDGRPAADLEIGEILLKGGSLASGYLPSIELPKRPFFNDEAFYPTGDLGFLSEGELFITGRTGERFKINGQSFFAPDFENSLTKLPFVKIGRAVAFESDGVIKIAFEPRSLAALRNADTTRDAVVSQILADLGVKLKAEDVLLLRPGRLEKTSSGKVKRTSMAKDFRSGALANASPWEYLKGAASQAVQKQRVRVAFVLRRILSRG